MEGVIISRKCFAEDDEFRVNESWRAPRTFSKVAARLPEVEVVTTVKARGYARTAPSIVRTHRIFISRYRCARVSVFRIILLSSSSSSPSAGRNGSCSCGHSATRPPPPSSSSSSARTVQVKLYQYQHVHRPDYFSPFGYHFTGPRDPRMLISPGYFFFFFFTCTELHTS